jgi:hypothetical protein
MINFFQLDYADDPTIKGLLTKYVEIFKEREEKRHLLERRRFPLENRLKETIVGQVEMIRLVILLHKLCF